jgi:exonuclease VII small subunit
LQYPPGCGLLGWYLEKHAKQLERAIQMYRLACKSKVAAACKRLEQLLNQKKQPEKTAPKKTIKK